MPWWIRKHKIRRKQVREKRARVAAALRGRERVRLYSWPVLISSMFLAALAAVTLVGESQLPYSIGQRVDRPVIAAVDFKLPDPAQTLANRNAARAATPSYYSLNTKAGTFERIRADLRQMYQAAVDADTFDEFEELAQDKWPTDEQTYRRLRSLVELPDDAGRRQFSDQVDGLPLESEYVVRNQSSEPRDPRTTTDYIVLVLPGNDGQKETRRVPYGELIPQGNDRALRGSAAGIAKRMRPYQEAVAEVVFRAFRDQPTIIFNQERTIEEMRRAAETTPEAMTTYKNGSPFILADSVLGSQEFQLLRAERAAYQMFLQADQPESELLRLQRWLRRSGVVALVLLFAIGLLIYAGMHQHRVFEVPFRTIGFTVLVLATVAAGKLLDVYWSQRPELLIAPCLLSASVFSIVYPRRFAVGAMCIVAVIVATAVEANLTFLLVLLVGVAVTSHQLDEIRSRTKLISAGAVTALAIMVAAGAGGLKEDQPQEWLLPHVCWSGGCALLAAFVVSGSLPFIERMFRVATSLTLLEWRDPTKRLLQLLAREAPGTYNHSLVLGTLAEAACERISANGLLAQVGALYHDIGKIHKADYFVENQTGGVSRHENLAPTMSLLIIVGHVKDGIEMAKEYKLPRVLHPFIAEHHGTTVVRYFHHMATTKQPAISSGKHDRDVPEAEFRYAGPKPRTRESAVVMLCDGVEGAVRSLNEPTVGRIESVVHQIVSGRLNDGQLSDCDMTMRDVRLVEESLVKSLCSIYHGRVAYPKATKSVEAPRDVRRKSV